MSEPVFRDFRGVEGAVKDAEEGKASTPAQRSKIVVTPRSNGVTSEQALASERAAAADEGTRAFGTPLGTENQRQQKAQSTDESQ